MKVNEKGNYSVSFKMSSKAIPFPFTSIFQSLGELFQLFGSTIKINIRSFQFLYILRSSIDERIWPYQMHDPCSY